MPQTSTEQVQLIQYFPGTGGTAEWQTRGIMHEQQSRAASQVLDFPSLSAGLSVQAELK